MSDLSDPTALPETLKEHSQRIRLNYLMEGETEEMRRKRTEDFDSLLAHFAAELDGLRAQIEEAPHGRSCASEEDQGDDDQRACTCWKSKSPRGTVAQEPDTK